MVTDFERGNIACRRIGAWTSFGDVENSELGVRQCAQKCRGYRYFSLECPREHSVQCKCARTLAGSKALPDEQCNSRNKASDTVCVGPFTRGPYMMGGHETGSVYFTLQRSYSSHMIEACKQHGMKPVCNSPKFCQRDQQSIYIGNTPVKTGVHLSDDGLTHGWYRKGLQSWSPPKNKNSYWHNVFPTGFSSISQRWDGLCGYTGSINNNARCNIPKAGKNSESWRTTSQSNPGFVCGTLRARPSTNA